MKNRSAALTDLEQSMESILEDIGEFVNGRLPAGEAAFDVQRQAQRIRRALSESEYIKSLSFELIAPPNAHSRYVYIANAWKALGYASAAGLLIEAGKREYAWSALVEAKDALMWARIVDIESLRKLDLDQSREKSLATRKVNGQLMREFVAKAVRDGAVDRKWSSAKQAAKAVVDEAIKYAEVAYGVFRTDDPTATLVRWMQNDPIVSEAFWATCKPSVKETFDKKRKQKRRGDRWLKNMVD